MSIPQPARKPAKKVPSADQARSFSIGAFQRLSLAHLWLFEELEHPFGVGFTPILDNQGQPALDADGTPRYAPLSMRDLARAIYVFCDPLAAQKELAAAISASTRQSVSWRRASRQRR